MKIYLAGPMRGLPDENHPAFDAGAKILRDAGHEVFSPAECARALRAEGTATVRRGLGKDLAWICEHADGVALLPGWDKSKGALAERATAIALGLTILHPETWLA